MGVRTRSSAGGAQFGLSIDNTAAGIALTVPRTAMCAEIYVRTAAIVFTRDGTAPTATLGIQANAGDIIMLNSREELENFRAIRQGGTNATLDVEYFNELSS